MKEETLNGTISDLIVYLEDIKLRAKRLTPAQKNQLREIIRSILCLLVALAKSSNLGKVSINFRGEDLQF